VFPLDQTQNSRSSSEGGKRILAAAVKSLDANLSDSILAEKNWRYNYPSYFVDSVKLGLKSKDSAIAIAESGLAEIYSGFDFVRDGKNYNLSEAMSIFSTSPFFKSVVVKGKSAKPSVAELFRMPYRGKDLVGTQVLDQLRKWSDFGTISQDVVPALTTVLEDPNMFFALEDRCFVTLGSSSEMGPFECLLNLGATVIAIDLPGRPNVWRRLIDVAVGSCGTLIIPVKNDETEYDNDYSKIAKAAGANILTQTPEIAEWLVRCVPEKELCIGSYTYLDSDLFVRIAVAGDAISSEVLKKRPGTTLAFLSSGADVFVVDEAAVKMAESRMGKLWHSVINTISFGKYLQPNSHELCMSDSGEKFYICDGLATIQGQNYALAKRLQHWRAISARNAGVTVSSNIAPATFTDSVEHNPLTLYISRAIWNFEPIEVYDRVTTKALMTMLLLHDMYSHDSASNPSTTLRNPQELMSTTAIDCGVWRSGVKLGTSGEMA